MFESVCFNTSLKQNQIFETLNATMRWICSLASSALQSDTRCFCCRQLRFPCPLRSRNQGATLLTPLPASFSGYERKDGEEKESAGKVSAEEMER